MLDPMMLAGLMGKGGGSTKVNQSTSTTSQSAISLSISNILPGGTGGQTGGGMSVGASSVASQTPEDSPSPSYGSFPDTSLDTAVSTGSTLSLSPSMLSNPYVIGGAVLLVGAAVFTSMRRKK